MKDVPDMPRSYILRNKEGQLIRRNRRHILWSNKDRDDRERVTPEDTASNISPILMNQDNTREKSGESNDQGLVQQTESSTRIRKTRSG